MAATEPTTPVVSGEPKPAPNPVAASYTKEQVDSAAAAARRESELKFKETQERLDAFEAKEKKRLDAELTETEKLKNEIVDRDTIIKDLEVHKEWRTAWETKEAESIEKEMEDLDDDTKEIILALPLEKRRNAINKFKASSAPLNPDNTKGIHIKQVGVPTSEEVYAIREKFGATSLQFRDAYAKYSGIKL